MWKALFLTAILLASVANPLTADEPKPAPVKLTIRLCEGDKDAVLVNTTARAELIPKEMKAMAIGNASGGVRNEREARILGRTHIPFGVLFELTVGRSDATSVELDAIISVLGGMERTDDGAVYTDQAMKAALTLVPGKPVKISLPRDWFANALVAEMLKTKDGPVWVELVLEAAK